LRATENSTNLGNLKINHLEVSLKINQLEVNVKLN
jgi:hypothetical protein